MAGGRGRRRRQAAKSYEENDRTRWLNAIRIPLPPSDQRSHPPDGNPSLPSQDEEAMLELSGFQSPTRTIFARIHRRPMELGKEGRDSECPSRDQVKEGPNTRSRNHWRVENLVGAIVNEILVREEALEEEAKSDSIEQKRPRTCVESSQSLLELGSVWVLDPASADRPQNKPVWKRLLKEIDLDQNAGTDEEDSILWFDQFMTLRVHSRPSRYPMAQKFGMALEAQKLEDDGNPIGCGKTIGSTGANMYGGIVYERAIENIRMESDPNSNNATKLVFTVLNKPVGMPSHSTVDNAVENLLYQYQKCRELDYATLPQRLDTETSGLILVSTHPRFATYFSKLLEQKTRIASKCTVKTSTPSLSLPSVISNPSIQKRYRCLVVFPEDSLTATPDIIQKKYVQTLKIVEHYVDANSKAPKTFVDAANFNESDASTATTTPTASKDKISTHTAGSTHKWQLCKLRIRSMTAPIKSLKICSEETSMGSLEHLACSELEIELLTGRTHQIRGQLAALGCPILGDPLYGSAHTGVNLLSSTKPREWRDRSVFRMALQCCELAFPVDPSVFCEISSLSMDRKRGASSDRPASEARSAKESATYPEDFKADSVSLVSSDKPSKRVEFRLDSAWWRNG